MSDARALSGAANGGWEEWAVFLSLAKTAAAQEENPVANADGEYAEATTGEIGAFAGDVENDEEALVTVEATRKPSPWSLATLSESSAMPLWGVIGLLLLVAALAAAAIALVVSNGHLQEKLAAASASRRAVPRSRPVTQVRVGKLHAQGAREYQQDCFGVSDAALLQSHGMLAVVADGMGGLSDGDKVSAAAVETALNTFVMLRGRGAPEETLLTLARTIVQNVNGILGPDGYRRSGSTLAMGLVKGNLFSFLSVGDSHIYLLRNGALMLLNREHVYRTELVVRGVNGDISLSEVYSNERGAGLVSYVGMGALKYVDMPAEPLAVFPGDRFIVMSDGVYNALEMDELRGALTGEPEAAAARLGALIAGKAHAGQDNYTAVILQCN